MNLPTPTTANAPGEATTGGRAAFLTYGCRLNQYDTQGIRQAILELGYTEVDGDRDLDLIVVNSCTVTARAGERVESRVRTLSRRNPAATILVTGCLTDDDRARLAEIPAVEHIVGNEEKDLIPAIITGKTAAGQESRRRADRSIFDLKVDAFHGHTRAFVKVQDGCDSFCTYCIIPYLRGSSRSRGPEDVVEEATRLATAGHRELVLTGIHLREYGKDLGVVDGLVTLLRDLRAIDGVDRVRLSSIGERAFTDPFLELFASDPGLCPSFHVPLQSGCDTVLERMRRDYTVAEYEHAIERIRAVLPRATISTDLMVGFPGETEEEFEASLDTCRRVRFSSIHRFPYSPRPRTKAARFPDHVDPAVKQERMARVNALAKELSRVDREERIGHRVDVLLENRRQGVAVGLSREGVRVSFPDGFEGDRGEEVSARLVELTDDGLLGVPEPREGARDDR